MKKMTNVFTASGLGFLLALSGCQMRDDTGVWSGAVVSAESGLETQSCGLEIDITHSSDQVSVNRLTTDCGSYYTRWKLGTYEIHGGSLWRNGQIVGWAKPDGSAQIDLTDTRYGFDESYPFPANRVVITWRKFGDSLEFTEEAYFGGRVRRTHGWLRRNF